MNTTDPTTPTGAPLTRTLRHELEACFGTDLRDVRLHTSSAADRIARALSADAVASGTDVWFAAGRCEPGTSRGRRLVAHEVAHVVQQQRRLVVDRDPYEARWEAEAEAAATAFMSGRRARISNHRPDGRLGSDAPVAQRHDSFEHRILGDVPTTDLVAVANDGPGKKEVLEQQLRMLELWTEDPEAVTAEQINAVCPWIRTIRLEDSGLLVTYGELNALPDYIARGEVADSMSKDVLLPIVQFVRQQSYIQLSKLLDRSVDRSNGWDKIVIPDYHGKKNCFLAIT